jgi:hypothetical protein
VLARPAARGAHGLRSPIASVRDFAPDDYLYFGLQPIVVLLAIQQSLVRTLTAI